MQMRVSSQKEVFNLINSLTWDNNSRTKEKYIYICNPDIITTAFYFLVSPPCHDILPRAKRYKYYIFMSLQASIFQILWFKRTHVGQISVVIETWFFIFRMCEITIYFIAWICLCVNYLVFPESLVCSVFISLLPTQFSH